VFVLLLIACGVTEPATPYVGDVDVFGIVKGWDGSGDVAIEACGSGTLVDENGGFVAQMASTCDLRVVWERSDSRATGPWTPLNATGPIVKIALDLPDPKYLRPLSDDALREKRGYIRSAQKQLDAAQNPDGQSGSPETSRDY